MGTRTSQFDATVDQILGYLNFSSGNQDPAFFVALNSLFAGLAGGSRSRGKKEPTCQRVHQLLVNRLEKLPRDNQVFQNADQARRVIELCFEHVLPAYLDFHRDVLFHQSDEFLFNSLFIGRVLETILTSEPMSDPPIALTRRALWGNRTRGRRSRIDRLTCRQVADEVERPSKLPIS